MPIFVSEMKNDRMKRKISFLFLWLVLFGGLFFACNRKSFTVEEQKLRELVYHYPDSALRLLELAIDSPEVLKVSKSMWSYYHSQAKIIANMTDAQREAEAYSSKAVNHLVRGEDSLAMVYRWKSLNALKKDTVISDGTKKKIRNEIIQIGRLYTRKKQYDKAMEAYRTCLKEPLSNNMFDDYLLPYLVIGLSTEYKTIPVVIQMLVGSNGNRDMGAMMAMLVLAIIPIVIFYLMCQKHIIEGVVSGAVKG